VPLGTTRSTSPNETATDDERRATATRRRSGGEAAAKRRRSGGEAAAKRRRSDAQARVVPPFASIALAQKVIRVDPRQLRNRDQLARSRFECRCFCFSCFLQHAKAAGRSSTDLPTEPPPTFPRPLSSHGCNGPVVGCGRQMTSRPPAPLPTTTTARQGNPQGGTHATTPRAKASKAQGGSGGY
jgi:hypothetical protein